MDPSEWGPSGWRILHRMAHNAHFKSQQDALAFYASLQYILPCVTCQRNYKQHIVSLPFPKRLSEVGKWVYDVHNKVTHSKQQETQSSDIPEYVIIRKMYKSCSFDDQEWIFVTAIVKMHPGKYKMTPEYLEHLNTFLSHWTKASGLKMPSTLSSKMKLQEWVKSHTKGLHLKCKMKCTDVCTR